MTVVEGLINYTFRMGQYLVHRGLLNIIINNVWKHSQPLFCYMNKQTENQERFWKDFTGLLWVLRWVRI